MVDLSNNRIVSFVDKQLALTQKRHAEMEQSLAEVMSAIEDNARLQLNLHELTLEIMRANSLKDATTLLCEGMKARFDLKNVQVWGLAGSYLPTPVPTEQMQQFMSYMCSHAVANGGKEAFPSEIWTTSGVMSGCAFALRGRSTVFGVLVIGRKDDAFIGELDTLFLQQFVSLIGFWFEKLCEFTQLVGNKENK
jgi:uncharacterized protein YigA (DUF484 family)